MLRYYEILRVFTYNYHRETSVYDLDEVKHKCYSRNRMNIETVRQIQSNLTDQQFAEKLGMCRGSWNRIKNQRVPISDKFLVRLARAFPEKKIFLSTDVQEGKLDVPTVNHNAPQNAQNLLNKLKRILLRR